MELILASTSPYRQTLMERLGVTFRSVAPRVDESAAKNLVSDPRELAAQLARAKAEDVAADAPSAVVIGCDQLMAFEGEVFGKPGIFEGAVQQLSRLSGQTHELITALFVTWRDRSWTHTDVTRLNMRSLNDEEIERYVAADAPLDCAGAYKIEERGIVLFDRIESDDHTAITGLPLIALTTILRELGFHIP